VSLPEDGDRKADRGGRLAKPSKGMTALLEAERLGLIEDYHEERQLEAKGRFTAEEWKAVAKYQKPQKQAIAAELMMAGCGRRATEDLIHVPHGTIMRWIEDDPEGMQGLLTAAATQLAVLELPRTMNILMELRFSNNHAVARKAVLDAARAAGKGIDSPAPVNLQVNMNGQNNQFNLTTRELEAEITKLAAALGPEAEKLAKGELDVKPIGLGAGNKGADGGAAGRDAQGTPPPTPPRPA
jgi:hypothetical protein